VLVPLASNTFMSVEISLERPVSALSASSTKSDMDWNRSNGAISAVATTATPSPSPRRRRVDLPPEGTPVPNRQRSLAQLLRIHAEKGLGEEIVICPEEERRLKEALDNWVNSADDDTSFSRSNGSGSGSSEDEGDAGSGVDAPARRPSSRSHHLDRDCTTMNIVNGDHHGHSGDSEPPVTTI